MHLSDLSEKKRYEYLLMVIALLFIAWNAVMVTTPVGEGDFFWHVKTGEWIWHHKALPASDPFSFTVNAVNPVNPESKRIPFLLKQYWLGQLAFYALWSAGGEGAMVLLRAVCYTGILGLLFFWSRQLHRGIPPLLAVIACGSILRNYSNERPQIFAFVLMPLALFLLERLVRTGVNRIGPLQAIALPLVMLLWSNCHGSFILGIVVITLYGAGTIAETIRNREQLQRPPLMIMAAAILVTIINPNGYGAFTEFFTVSKGYTRLVAEFTSPLLLAWKFQVIDYAYWGALLAAAAVVAYALRRIAVPHFLVVTALAALSLTATRYIPFFILATPLLCRYIPQRQPQRFAPLIPILLVAVLIGTADYQNVLKFRAERAFPAKASAFLNEAAPQGNMFNYIGWGGYLMCYSHYPVFVDGRTLIEDLLPIHNSILAGQDWRATLDRFGINFMIIPGTDAITLQAYPLMLQLLGDESWSLIYQDETALIFIRNSAANNRLVARYALDKNLITAHIQERWQWQTTNNF